MKFSKHHSILLMKWLFILVCQVLISFSTYSQTNFTHDTLPEISIKKFTPVIEIITVNATMNRINYWLRKQEWANVNFSTWKRNLKSGFHTDGDRFSTNFLGHPLQGGWYYNAARSSGYNYWQSAPHVVFGSLTWEMFGENETASEIDINTTTFGGIHLGEISHRLSKSLLANHKNRKFKKIRTATSFLLDPLGSFNSWIFNDVKTFMQHKNITVIPVQSFLSLGINVPYSKNDEINLPKRSHFKYHLIYGDLFNRASKFKPFDYFTFHSWLDLAFSDKEEPILVNITSNAPIARFPIRKDFTFTISQHYDYLNNHIFDQGDMSLTTDLFYRKLTNKMRMITTVKAGVILFGSTSSRIVDYLKSIGEIDNNRSYVYGNGFSFEGDLMMDIQKIGVFSLNYNAWFLDNKSDIDGSENSQILIIGHSLPISNNHSLVTEFYNYNRISKYNVDGFVSSRKGYSEFRLALRYAF
jgi:hypothetical protein